MFRTRVNIGLFRSVRGTVGVTALLTGCLFGPLAHAQVACDALTVSYWRFDGDFTDSCGTLDGVPVGLASIVTSGCAPFSGTSGCLVLTGDPDRVDLPAPFAPSIGTLCEGTIEAWVYLEGPEGGCIFNHGIAARFTDLILDIRPTDQGDAYASVLHTTATGNTDNALPGFALEEWHHMAWTWDASAIKTYLDGVEVGSRQVNASPAFTGNEAEIGSDDQEVCYWKGRVDEIRLSNIARDPTEFLINTDPCDDFDTFTALFEPPVTLDNFELQDGGTLPIKFHLLDVAGEVVPESMNVRLDVGGPGEDEAVVVYDFVLTDGSLRLDDSNDPPHYIANFNTKLYPVIEGEEYVATIYLEDVCMASTRFAIDVSGHGRGNHALAP